MPTIPRSLQRITRILGGIQEAKSLTCFNGIGRMPAEERESNHYEFHHYDFFEPAQTTGYARCHNIPLQYLLFVRK